MTDLPSKYSRLAQEYAKIKAQNQVLRKAVLDEQENCMSIKDAMRSKEQLLRRSEQEMDSLTFRNQQMEKRVELLQEELEKLANSKTKKKVKSDGHLSNNHNSAVDEDLRNKIKENELLHKQVHEADTKTRILERELTDDLTKAQREARQYRELLESSEDKHKALVSSLQEEKAILEMHLQTAEEDKKNAEMTADKSTEDLKILEDSLGNEVENLQRVVQDTIVFNDCSVPEYTVLNIPPHDRRSQSKAQTLLKESKSMVLDFCKGLGNLHIYSEQRSRLFPVNSQYTSLTIVNTKLCDFLHDCGNYVNPISDAFDDFCESCFNAGASPVSLHTAIGLEKFASAFAKYIAYLNKIIPYHLYSIDEESNAAICAPTLQAKNKEFHHLYKRLLPSLQKLSTYLTLVASCDMSRVFNAKVAIEHQLPTSSPQLKTTDEFLLSAFLSLSSNMAKLASFVSENSDFFTHTIPYRTRGVSLIQTHGGTSAKSRPSASSAIISLCQRSMSYLQRINPSAPPLSVPYEQSLKDHSIALNSAESHDGLVKRLEESATRIATLEQEKEHWLLEAQLLSMKLDRVKQKGVVESSSPKTISAADTDRPRNDSSSITTLDTAMLGTMAISSDIIDGSDEETREETIKRHLTSRLTDTSSRLQQAESKALHLYTECQALHNRLDLGIHNLETLQESNNKSNQKISQLQDELSVTRKNYEEQLSLMSDHLASMNDKLSTQKDEIENLKHQPVKLSKKFRSKVPGLN